MRPYALTYPQLINQALALGLTPGDLRRLHCTHDLAQSLADGVYRAQGIPLLNHLVRCGSIAMAEQLPLDVVLAALLHAAPVLHRFDDSRRRPLGLPQKRQLEHTAGKEVLTLLEEYGCLRWYTADALQRHLEQLESYPTRTRHTLVLRLINELEDHLDDAMCYSPAARSRRRLEAYGDELVALAEGLQRMTVARELQETRGSTSRRALPAEVVAERLQGYELPSRRLWEAPPLERVARRGWRALRRRIHRSF